MRGDVVEEAPPIVRGDHDFTVSYLCGQAKINMNMANSLWQKLPSAEDAGGTACATTADQQFANQVGEAFSLPGLLPRAVKPAGKTSAQ